MSAGDGNEQVRKANGIQSCDQKNKNITEFSTNGEWTDTIA